MKTICLTKKEINLDYLDPHEAYTLRHRKCLHLLLQQKSGMTSVDGLRMDYVLLDDEICFSYIGTDEWRNKCKKIIIAVKTFAIPVQRSNPWHWVRTGRGVAYHFFFFWARDVEFLKVRTGVGGGGFSDETIVEAHLLKKNLQESLFFLPKFGAQQVNEQWVINEPVLLQLKSILSLISIWEDSDRD